ncbi:MAG: agmatinase [Pseudomonadota bacterium]|nr:agmatinase [Pseudomonadota bacterium]
MAKTRKIPHFLASEISLPAPGNALFHIIPVPYEKSVSYGTGTAQGPAAILESSQQLELFDGTGIPAEHGIYTHSPIDCKDSAEIVLHKIADIVSEVLDLEKFPVLLGGEHTISAGAFTAIKKNCDDIGIVQFDAHADLRDTYEGTTNSHACVMHRALDMNIPVFQIGVRSLSYDEHLLREKLNIGHLDAAIINKFGIPDSILPPDFPDKIYLTFDVDAFDPSIMPATGTPEPGGLNWYQTFQMLESIITGRNIIGLDVVELAPIDGMHAPDFSMARFIYNLFGAMVRK